MADAIKPVTYVESGSLPGGGIWELWKFFDSELVNATADVESILSSAVPGQKLGEYRSFGAHIVATSGGTIDVAVKIQQSFDNTAANYAVPDSGGTIITLSNTSIHIVTVTPTPMAYMRFQLDGGATNAATTRVTMYLWVQT